MKQITLIWLCLMITCSGIAQQYNAPAAPVSPTTASLMQYSQIPVSKNTGVPQVSFDLYTVRSGSLSVPISLSYHASGIKTQQEASWVGLGWSLNAGGVITRSIRGRSDVDGYDPGFFNSPAIPTDYDGEWFSGATVASGSEIALMKSYFRGEYDPEPDIFYFNFLNNAGKFIFKKQSVINDTITGTCLDQKHNLQIRFLTNNKTFFVTDGNGVRYFFRTKEYTSVESHPAVSPGSSEIEDMDFEGFCLDNHISGWYLDKIESPSSLDSITFSYNTPGSCEGILSTTSLNETKYVKTAMASGDYGFYTPASYHEEMLSRSMTQPADLTQISFREGTVEFYHSARLDIEGINTFQPVKLDSFKVFNNQSQAIGNTVRFDYDYFNGTGSVNQSRLRLERFYITDEPHEFIYDSAVSLPSKTTKSIDYWGYYNGYGNNSLIPKNAVGTPTTIIYADGGNRNTNASYLIAGMLKEIRYPTGGKTTFHFEPNDFPEGAPIYNNVQVSAQSNFSYLGMGDTLYKEIDFYVPNTSLVALSGHLNSDRLCGTIPGEPEAGEPYALLVSLPTADPGPFTAIDQYSPSDIVHQFEYGVCNTELEFSSSTQLSLAPGWYRLVVATRIYQTYAYISIQYDTITGYQPGIFGGGVRVQKVNTNDGNGLITVRKFVYRDSSNNARSSGVLISSPQYTFSTTLDYPNATYDNYSIYQSSSFNPMTPSAQGGFVGYDHVTELLGENGENGKISSFYENGTYSNTPYIPPAEFNLNGHLVLEKVYRADGVLKSKTESVFGQYGPSTEDVNGMTTTTYPFLFTYVDPAYDPCAGAVCLYPVLLDNDLALNYLVNYYPVRIDWNRLNYTATTQYFPSGATYDTVFYAYNTSNKQISTTTYIAGRSKIINTFKFPTDYNSNAGSVYPKMVQKNMINYAVEAQQWIVNDQGTKMKSSRITEFSSEFNDKFIAPLRVYNMKNSELLSTGTVGHSPGATGPFNSLFFNSGYFDKITESKFDSTERMVRNTQLDSRSESYIWDYNNSLLIARCSNVNDSMIAATSFEADGKGRWSFSGPTSADATSPTGRKCYDVHSGALSRSGLPSGYIFIISYWAKNGSVLVNGGGPSRTGKTINGWTYYEHEIEVTSATVSTLSGTRFIDELRLYPKNALMYTYTHDPLVGTTTECDATGKITYYEYDKSNRLQRVKDQYRNVVKVMDYKLKQSQNQ